MSVQVIEHFSASKARVVARTASIGIETSAASAVRDACCSIVAGVQHSIYLRLLIESLSSALYEIKLQVRRPNKNPMDY